MSRNSQYKDDIKRLASNIERLTGIPADRTLDHINEYGINTILSGANAICTTKAQREKLTKIFAFKNLYETIRQCERDNRYQIGGVNDAINYFVKYFADIADREHIVAAFLSSQNEIITTKHVTAGTLSSATIHHREIIKEALFCNAAGVIVAHNHPSGATTISSQDIQATDMLGSALIAAGIELLDHIVVGGDKAISLSDLGHVKDYSNPAISKAASPVLERTDIYKSKPLSIKAQMSLAKEQRDHEQKANPKTTPKHNINQNHIER